MFGALPWKVGPMFTLSTKWRFTRFLGIPDEAITLTPIRLYFISIGFVQWLSNRKSKSPSDLRISIGRDPRLSG